MRIERYAEAAKSIGYRPGGWHWRLWTAALMLTLLLTGLAAQGIYPPGDLTVARAVQAAHSFDLLRPLSEALYQFGAIPVYPAFGLAAAAAVTAAYRRPVAGAFVLMAMLARPFGVMIKELVERPRPADPLVTYVEGASGFSFPSGHVFGTVLLVGFVCFVLFEQESNRTRRLAIVLGGVVVALLMGAQRIYAGAHWPSDVVGGYLWGGVVLFVLIQAYGTAAQRIHGRAEARDEE